MTYVRCSVDERYVNPLFEVFDGGDFVLSSYRDVEETATTMQIFFEDPAAASRASAALVAAGKIVGLDLAPETGSIPDEDWRFAYRKHFKTEFISERLAIVPEWEVGQFPARLAERGWTGTRKLVLDPGMAFGTGQHATTRACLEYVDLLAADDADRSFLDVGCGSGILAIAARLEGFRDVAGFDIDPEAVANANANAGKNGLTIRFVRGDLSNQSTLPGVQKTGDRQFDVVAANVLGPVLVRFADEIAPLVAKDGLLILSGILEEIYPDVRGAYLARGFAEVSSKLVGEWRTGLFRRTRRFK
ncbi:MAG: 50S ribosomal protein L11 methyltransferase [Kiritimatiellia bacterium]